MFITALEQDIKINMSLWSRDVSSRQTLYIYLQVEITGQILFAKGLEIHLLLVCNLSRILEKPISKPTEMGATSASGKSVVMRVFSSHQQQHFVIKRNQKINVNVILNLRPSFLIEPCDLLDMATWTTEHHLWPSRWEGKRDLNWLLQTSCRWYSAAGDFLSSVNVLSNIVLLEVLSTYAVHGFEQHTSTGSERFAFLVSGVAQILNGQWSLKEWRHLAVQIWWLQGRLIGKSLTIGWCALLKNALA